MPPSAASTYDDPAIEKAAREEIRRERLARTNSADSVASHAKMPLLGIADDPEAEIDEIVAEVKAEIEQRRRRGSLMQGFDVKKAVQEKLKQFNRKE
jgi:lysophospholipid acyltransferase